MSCKGPVMKYLPAIRAIRVVQIGLAILLSAALNFSNAKADAHVFGLKQAQLACDQSSADRSRYWADASVVLAALQGFYRPPRG